MILLPLDIIGNLQKLVLAFSTKMKLIGDFRCKFLLWQLCSTSYFIYLFVYLFIYL
jgi:hypothetical protein